MWFTKRIVVSEILPKNSGFVHLHAEMCHRFLEVHELGIVPIIIVMINNVNPSSRSSCDSLCFLKYFRILGLYGKSDSENPGHPLGPAAWDIYIYT